jgi:tetratricopeptide (TPR) repeat protein
MLRPKTIQRLVILLGVISVLVTASIAVWVSHQRGKQRQLAEDRKLGVAAYQSGDYALALDRLRSYTAAFPDDYEALYAYGVSRLRVETGSFRHVAEARQVFEQLLRMRPDDLNAAHFLLDLYVRFRYVPEVLSLSSTILQKDPADVAALRAQTDALAYTGKTQQALAAAEKLNQVAPTDLPGLVQTYTLLVKLNRPPSEVLERFARLQQAHPDDPRFEMMLGAAAQYAGDKPAALKWLRAAAAHPLSDPVFVQTLTGMFDRLRLFGESQALLDRAAAASDNKDPAILRVLVQRFWQSGRYEQAIDRLKDLDATNPQTRSDLLAIKALSLFSLNRRSEANEIVEALKNRRTDNAAQAWATALAVRYDDVPDARDAIVKYQSALARDRDNAVICCWIGDAYARLGENDLALRQWRQSAELMSSWPAPAIQMSRALLAADRPAAAVEAAGAAVRGAPESVSARVALAVALYAALQQSPNPVETQQLEQMIDQLQRAVPDEPETLPIAVALKARSGKKDAAAALVRDALSPQRPTSVGTLSRLLAVSRREKLGLEAEISARLDQATAAAGGAAAMTPRIAYERAIDLAQAGKPSDGLLLLTSAAKAAAPSGDGNLALQWRLAEAEYRDNTGDAAGARAAWIAIGDAHPDDPAVQSLILRSARGAWEDRAFVSRTIERVHQLTGDEGQLWRLSRAKLLMSSPDKAERAKANGEAVGLLTDLVRAAPDVPEYRLLLAQALLAQGNRKDAADHLRVAVEMDPTNAAAMVQLAQLLQEQGRFDDARRYLDRAVGAGSVLPPQQREVVATLLARQGAIGAALSALAPARETLDTNGKVMLAELYRKSGDPQSAEGIYAALLKDTTTPPSAMVLSSAAEFYASQARTADAQAALDRLAADQRVPQLTRDLLVAQFNEEYGSLEVARDKFIAAASSAPDQPRAWRELVLFWLRHDRPADAIAAADEALKHLPNNEELTALKTRAQVVLAGLDEKAELQPLIEQLAKNPRNKSQVEMLQVVQDARWRKLTPDQYAQRLRAIADADTDYLPAQKLLVRQYLLVGKVDEAARIVDRTMDARPTDPEAAQLAVGVYESAGRWRDAKRSAEKWRQRTLDRPLEADLAVARAELALKDPAAAQQQLAPYLAEVRTQPEQRPGAAVLYARSLAASGKAADARALLEPLLSRDPRWRAAWLNIAAADVPDGATAAQWLNAMGATAIPATAGPAERLALAATWQAVGSKFNLTEANNSARAIYSELAARVDVGKEVLQVAASGQLECGDLAGAEQSYRRILEIDPNQPDAMNNLAYILLQRGEKLEEARGLAEKAVASRQNLAGFYDTLARILAKLGDRAKAIQTFETAIKLDPQNLEALVGLATTLHADGRHDKAAELLHRIDKLLSNHEPLREPLLGELKTLRDHVTRSMD